VEHAGRRRAQLKLNRQRRVKISGLGSYPVRCGFSFSHWHAEISIALKFARSADSSSLASGFQFKPGGGVLSH
jgi:hypothetical protein